MCVGLQLYPSIPPLSMLLICQGCAKAGANPSWLRVRGGVHPRQVAIILDSLAHFVCVHLKTIALFHAWFVLVDFKPLQSVSDWFWQKPFDRRSILKSAITLRYFKILAELATLLLAPHPTMLMLVKRKLSVCVAYIHNPLAPYLHASQTVNEVKFLTSKTPTPSHLYQFSSMQCGWEDPRSDKRWAQRYRNESDRSSKINNKAGRKQRTLLKLF